MAEIDPPSFSLGLDLDPSSSCSGPNIDPPSFSLGLDLDPPNTEIPCQGPNSHARSSHRLEDEDEDEEFKVCVLDSDIDDTPENPAPARLKRLRRGAYSKSLFPSNNQSSHQFTDKIEDDIEDFSSEDDHARKDEHKATGHHSLCSSSKIPRGNRISTKQLPSLSSCKTRKQESRTLASSSLEGMRDKRIFAEPDISPLRMFQLLSSDSDSDSDDLVRADIGKDANGNNFLKQRETSHGCCTSASGRSEPSTILPQKEHSHGSFSLEEACNVPTPALDDFCAEYYKAIKDKDAALQVPVLESSFSKGELRSQTINNRKKSHEADPGNALPPAHQYFFHQDPRIQRLVRSRLPHFFPLAALNDAGNKQPGISSIDYRKQFSHGENQGGIRASTEKRSRKGRNKSRETKFGEFSQASGGWVNPTHPESMPKDAGKRRVHADGQSAGRWYTVNGKRVYVAKNGQELTGKGAYKQYRKESGRGFKKTKQKTAAYRKK